MQQNLKDCKRKWLPAVKINTMYSKQKAPDGYNLLGEVVVVDFAKEDSTHIVNETIKTQKASLLILVVLEQSY